ncbi:CPBP family intramembrane metalloprotease [Puteibacter caeruleilacunae]|nr:CPBP family intramembrane metalloprotease [Puteibacter caeruleilacunae]
MELNEQQQQELQDLKKKPPYYPGVGASFGISGILIGLALAFGLLLPVLNKYFEEEATFLIYYLLMTGGTFWIAYAVRKNKTGVDDFTVPLRNLSLLPFIVFGTLALLIGIVSPISSSIPMPEFLEEAFKQLSMQKGLPTFFTIVIAAPILEELIFRGIILDGLFRNTSPTKAILLSSFLFGLVHLNPWQFVTAMVLGIFMGWIYYHTKSLFATILIHFTANASAFFARFLVDIDSMSYDMTLAEFHGGKINMLITITGCIIIAFICINFMRQEFAKNTVSDEWNNTIQEEKRDETI